MWKEKSIPYCKIITDMYNGGMEKKTERFEMLIKPSAKAALYHLAREKGVSMSAYLEAYIERNAKRLSA